MGFATEHLSMATIWGNWQAIQPRALRGRVRIQFSYSFMSGFSNGIFPHNHQEYLWSWVMGTLWINSYFLDWNKSEKLSHIISNLQLTLLFSNSLPVSLAFPFCPIFHPPISCRQHSPSSVLKVWFCFNHPRPENSLPPMAALLPSFSESAWTGKKSS